MHRRAFIRITGGGIVLAATATGVSGCSSELPAEARAAWRQAGTQALQTRAGLDHPMRKDALAAGIQKAGPEQPRAQPGHAARADGVALLARRHLVDFRLPAVDAKIGLAEGAQARGEALRAVEQQ